MSFLEGKIYFVRRALRNMRQSPFLCVAATGTVAVALSLLALFAVIVFNIQQVTSRWSQEIQVIAYFDEAPQGETLRQWQEKIEAYDAVSDVLFVSSEEAFSRFRERLGQDADLLDGLPVEVLPGSFEIRLHPKERSRAGVAKVVEALGQDVPAADLRYGQDWLVRFESLLVLMKMIGAILGGFLLFATLFIVANTIRLTLYTRRDELEVMSLVGATPLFIKLPFLFEGALQGLCGGGLALLSTFLLHAFFLRRGLADLLLATGGEQVLFLPLNAQIALLLAGTLLGFFGSLFSLRQLVRV